MSTTNPNKPIADWLKSKGYTPAEIKKVMDKLADHDHQTLSDAVFDSIGNDGQTLDEIVRGILQDAPAPPIEGTTKHESDLLLGAAFSAIPASDIKAITVVMDGVALASVVWVR